MDLDERLIGVFYGFETDFSETEKFILYNFYYKLSKLENN